MDLRSPYPYWLLRYGTIRSYPSLAQDLKSDIAVIGAGISGALVAWELTRAGFRVITVDRRHAGTGSTAASTALLQYEIDTPLYDLIKLVGEKKAIRSYILCRQAIDDLGKICRTLKASDLFINRPSFQFASFKKDVRKLENEYLCRRNKAKIDVKWLDEKSIREKFGFNRAAGLLSPDGAEVDAYRLTHKLLGDCIEKGSLVFDNTEIKSIRHHKKEIELVSTTNKKIRAKQLIIACGYESQKYIQKKVQNLHATYAIISEPFDNNNFWYKNAMIWETQKPYLYLRTTEENRILIGGKDTTFSSPARRDELLNKKAKELEKSFAKLFPHLLFRTDFKWAGTFASTKDGLPYIGSISPRPRTFFALGYGGNGITFSVIASQLLRDQLTGKKNPDIEIFSFNR